jgi:steroid delta-isomerase-like uncharacterized protein
MSEDSNRQLARRWFEEVWNQGRIAAIAEMYHPSGTATGFPEPDSVIRGPEEFAQLCQQFLDTFPDIHITVDDVLAEGDRVAVLWTATMTHTGDGLGFPASSKQVSLPGASFITCRDGMIIDGHNLMDFTRVRLQLQGKA